MSLAEFRQQALNLVNQRRNLHGSPELTTSKELESSAQIWAEALASKNSLENSAEAIQGKYGESISQRSSKDSKVDITADEVVTQWYKEKAGYNFSDASGKGGNFSQMVWLASKQVGFGKAFAHGKVIVVAHYSPPGNIRGKYAKNVNPPLDSDLEVVDLVGDLAGFHVTSREVLRDEEFDGGRPVVVEKERIQFEDAKGNTKEKVIERRFPKPKGSDKLETPGTPAPSTSRQNSQQPPAEAELRQGSVLLAREKDLTKFSTKVLNQHNKHRSKHGVRSLKLNPDLCALAQIFAEELSGKTKLYNSGAVYKGDRLGENIASRWSPSLADYEGEDVVDHWYNEGEKFNYSEEPKEIKGIGNFTQLVWKNSKELGVGKAVHKGTDGSHKAVVVCYYYPSGNVMPCFRENVLPPK